MSLVPHLPPHAPDALREFLRAHIEEAGGGGGVLGLSGGVDSALVARLARDALGPERVLGVVLPDRAYPKELLEETLGYGRELGIETRVVPIDGVEKALRAALPEVQDRTTWGNAKARTRMILLYTLARERGRLVLGTGNKSELLLGYFTKYGDGGADLLPLGDLYKTEVWELAERLALPKAVRTRAPTAGLWEGQTDEGELGLPYRELDQVLHGLEELRAVEEIAERSGIPVGTVRALEQRVLANRHKRRLPPIPKVGLRTIGLDWRD